MSIKELWLKHKPILEIGKKSWKWSIKMGKTIPQTFSSMSAIFKLSFTFPCQRFILVNDSYYKNLCRLLGFELALFLDSWSNISKLGWEENIFFANNGSGYPYELIYYWIYTWTESLSIKWEVSLYYSICSYHCIKGISSKVPAFFSTILNIISCWTSSVRLMNCYAESFYYLSLLLTDLNRYYMKSRCANLLV